MGSLVKSRLVAQIDVGGEYFVVRHVLGRNRLVCNASVKALMDSFRLPRTVQSADEEQSELLSILAEASIIRSAGNGEEERIRSHFAWRTSLPRHFLAVGQGSGAVGGMGDGEFAGPLRLSSSLAILRIEQDHYLITHPLCSPVQISDDLWELAQELGAPGADPPPDDKVWAADFLVRAGILWPSAGAEIEAARAVTPPPANGVIELRYPMLDRWRQSFVPYRVADVVGPRASVSAALIGPCKVQQLAAGLQYLATRRGWNLRLAGFLRPESALSEEAWTAVIMTASQFDARLYEAIGVGDLSNIKEQEERAIADTLRATDEIRARTAAPLLVFSLGRPGLSGITGYSPAIHSLNRTITSVNAQLAQELGARQHVYLIDEDWVALSLSRGVLWDDEINATGHHAPLSSWNWAILKPVVTDDSYEEADFSKLVPPLPEGQTDPSLPMAAAILGGIERLVVEPVRLVVIEPNDLLWRGRIGADGRGPVVPPTVYADVEDYVHSGLHEAFSILRRRGILLACISDTPLMELRAAWSFKSRQVNLVRLENLSAIRGGEPKDEALTAVCRELGIGDRNVLTMDLFHDYSGAFRGRVYRGDKWSIRRYLLTAPELDVLPRRTPA